MVEIAFRFRAILLAYIEYHCFFEATDVLEALVCTKALSCCSCFVLSPSDSMPEAFRHQITVDVNIDTRSPIIPHQHDMNVVIAD